MKQFSIALLFVTALHANTVTVDLLSGGQIPGDPSIGPYTVQVNGQQYAALCFDLFDNAYVGQTWTANVVGYANLNGVYFQNYTGYQQLYLAEAWIYTKITDPGFLNSTSNPTATQIALQDAAWGLFDFAAPQSPLMESYEGQALQAAANRDLGINLNNLSILVSPGHQGFIVDAIGEVPEGGTLLYSGIGLLVLAGFLGRFRKMTA